jgi:hypothetical protein
VICVVSASTRAFGTGLPLTIAMFWAWAGIAGSGEGERRQDAGVDTWVHRDRFLFRIARPVHRSVGSVRAAASQRGLK